LGSEAAVIQAMRILVFDRIPLGKGLSPRRDHTAFTAESILRCQSAPKFSLHAMALPFKVMMLFMDFL
jgi:hypothetical protein